MTTTPSAPHRDYLIAIAMLVPQQARQCEWHLRKAGYRIVLCPEEVTADVVIETVIAHHPHLLIIDDDIEWAPDIHVVLRLHADPAFATLDILLLPDKAAEIPQWTWHDPWPIAA